MIAVKLFLGLPVNDLIKKKLDQLDPEITNIYFESNEKYLQKVFYQEKMYLGKSVGEICEVEELVHFEKNIYSILDKIIPDYPLRDTSLELFCFSSSENLL